VPPQSTGNCAASCRVPFSWDSPAFAKGFTCFSKAWHKANVPGKLLLAGRIAPDVARRCAAATERPNVLNLGHVKDVADSIRSADVLAFPTLERAGRCVTYERWPVHLASICRRWGRPVAREGVDSLVRPRTTPTPGPSYTPAGARRGINAKRSAERGPAGRRSLPGNAARRPSRTVGRRVRRQRESQSFRGVADRLAANPKLIQESSSGISHFGL